LRRRIVGFCVVWLGLSVGIPLALASDQAQWKGKIVKEGDVTVVRNPKESIFAAQVLDIEEDYVLGGEAAETRYVLSHPYDMALDAAGNLYVADAGERNIKIFDKGGEYVRTIGRPGQGPGEFQFPIGLRILPGADEIIVYDLRRISVLSLTGLYLRQHVIQGLSSGFGTDAQGNVFLSIVATRSGETTLKAYSADMSRELAVVLTYQQDQGSDPFKPRAIWIMDQAGRVVFGDSKTYEISVLDAQGRLLKKISRDCEPVRTTQAEKNDLIGRTRRVLGPEAAKAMVFSARHSAFRSFFMDDAGRLFVETWERSADGRQDIYDIFDPEGRFVARTPLNPHPDFLNPLPRFIKDGKLYTIEPDPKGYEVVKRYTVKWKI
jgi:hypothetical protein